MARSPATRPEQIRRHNLGLLLEQIHRDGPLTRAELTQRLGLNRSTIGGLVADLVELGLVAERVPSTGADRAGRPSHVVDLAPDGPYVVAVDLQVDRIVFAGVALGGHVLDRRSTAMAPGMTPAREVAAIVAESVDDLIRAQPEKNLPIALAVSVPGSLSRDGAEVLFAPNLRWHREPLDALFRSCLAARGIALDVVLGNDANLAAMAENVRGAARGAQDLIFLLARMGVGAGIMSSGSVLFGRAGLAGEVGHMVLDANGPACHCGSRGCTEMYIGEAALLGGPEAGIVPTREKVGAVLAAARSGDADSVAAVAEVATYLGRTIANLVNLLNPQVVVVGGSLAEVLDLGQERVNDELHEHAISSAVEGLVVASAALGDDASLIGAAELAFSQILNDPASLSGIEVRRPTG